MKGNGLSPWQALGNAVVVQAVKDYRRAYNKLKKHPGDLSARHDVIELERFFVSPRFDIFTDLDGNMILRMQKKQFDREV